MKFITDQQKEHLTDENCFITEICKQFDSPISIAKTRVLPGEQTEWHYLKQSTEYYYILDGKGLAELEDRHYHLGRGDVLEIRPGTAQRIKNSAKEDLVFLCICLPPFSELDYFEVSNT